MAWIVFCEAQSHYVEDCWVKEYGTDFYATTPTRVNARRFASFDQAASVASDLSEANISFAFIPEQYNEFTEMQP